MNFNRIKIKGQNQKTHKTWKSVEQYRITWRREFMGVSIPPRFQACVRIHLPEGQDMWDFAGRHGPYKTFKAACEACEEHQRLWSDVIQATGIRRIQDLCGKIPVGYPIWIRKEMNAKVRRILENASNPERDTCESDQNDLTEASLNTASETSESGRQQNGLQKTPTNGPASSATGADGTTTRRTRRVPSKEIKCAIDSDAPPAAVKVSGRKRQSSKHTVRKSVSTNKKSKNTKRSSKRRKPQSPN